MKRTTGAGLASKSLSDQALAKREGSTVINIHVIMSLLHSYQQRLCTEFLDPLNP